MPNFRLMDDYQIAAFFMDAQQALSFILPQQLRVEAEVYNIRYPAFDYAEIMSVNTSGDMWDAGSIFFSGDINGKAEFLSARAEDMPFADIALDAYERGNHMAGIGYEWSTGEVIRAARFGRNLTADKANAARRVAEQFIHNIALSGSAEKNWTGFINNASVPTVATAAWTTATPAATILTDVNATILAPFNATRGVFQTAILLMPNTAIQLLAGILIPNTQTTVLDFIRTNNAITASGGGPLEIRGRFELETAGGGGTRRMVAAARDANVAQFHLPGAHTFLPPWQRSPMGYEVHGIMNLGGTEFRIPAGARYTDGI